MSEKIGLNPRFYSEIERGRRNPSLETITKVAAGLDVPVIELFRFEGNRELDENEEQIIALISKLLSKKGKKTKHKVRVVLEELVD